MVPFHIEDSLVCRLALYAVGCPPLVCFLEISALTGGAAPPTPPPLFSRPGAGGGAVSDTGYKHLPAPGKFFGGTEFDNIFLLLFSRSMTFFPCCRQNGR